MKYLIVTEKDNGMTCWCCRQSWTEVNEENYSGDAGEYSREEVARINEELKTRYPNSSIYRVAEVIKG